MTKNAMRVRIVPSGTSIGRLLPITQGKAAYGFLANELYFAAEGTFDFAVPAWGPQDVRVVLARPASVGMAVAKDTGVKEMKDLRGKRIGYVKGNPSVNVKNDAYLAFGGLKRKDVEVVWFGSYNAMKTAIINNQLDAMGSVTTSANMREIEASPRGLTWPPFPAADKAGWERIRKVADFFEPFVETVGAGVSKDKLGTRRLPLSDHGDLRQDERRRSLRDGLRHRRVDGHDQGDHRQRDQLAAEAVRQAAGRRALARRHHPLHEGKGLVDRRGPGLARPAPCAPEEAAGRLEGRPGEVQGARRGAGQEGRGRGRRSLGQFWDEYREKTLGIES